MIPAKPSLFAAEHPDLVARLTKLADTMHAELGDSAKKQKGAGVREPGRLQPGDLRYDWKPGQPLETTAHR